MTIFVSKDTDKKSDSKDAPPEVVTEVKLLVKDETKKPVAAAPFPHTRVATRRAVAVTAARRHYFMLKICAVMMILLLVLILVFVGVTMYRKICAPEKLYRGRCGVRFYDYQRQRGVRNEPMGEFEQQVMIEDYYHERIEVPSIGDTRRATVLHDFNLNVTAIVDKDQSVCFIMPLNRTLVKPPRNFWDMMLKLKSGYYIPDVNVVRENYRAVTPAVHDLSPFGFNVWKECSAFDTYRLVPEGEPVAMSKRSAELCKFAHEEWCLGDAGGPQMLCLNVIGCR